MNIEDVVSKLNWFYSLELNQVDLYYSQSKSFKGTYYGQVFERISYIEQQHVQNIGRKIRDLGGSPSLLGNVIAPIIGNIGGKMISLTGLDDTLKINILLEEKAMKDYKELIHQMEKENFSQELIKVLQNNYIDEDLHTVWFKSYLSGIDS